MNTGKTSYFSTFSDFNYKLNTAPDGVPINFLCLSVWFLDTLIFLTLITLFCLDWSLVSLQQSVFNCNRKYNIWDDPKKSDAD